MSTRPTRARPAMSRVRRDVGRHTPSHTPVARVLHRPMSIGDTCPTPLRRSHRVRDHEEGEQQTGAVAVLPEPDIDARVPSIAEMDQSPPKQRRPMRRTTVPSGCPPHHWPGLGQAPGNRIKARLAARFAGLRICPRAWPPPKHIRHLLLIARMASSGCTQPLPARTRTLMPKQLINTL
jgi:hypothetical protein